ncbi:MAG TPA: hypothetical protein VIL17_00090 [Coriobacteriia bacterium]
MATRSPHNDRYKTELKGKTRKSASSAKPKRDLADLTPASSTKKSAAKKSRWGRGPATQTTPAFEPTEKMKQLRRIWWMLWTLSLVIAVGIILLQKAGASFQAYVPFAWGLWAASMAGAFYLEFTPIRKARMEAMEAARSGHKKTKADVPSKAKKAPALSDNATLDDVSEDATSTLEDK